MPSSVLPYLPEATPPTSLYTSHTNCLVYFPKYTVLLDSMLSCPHLAAPSLVCFMNLKHPTETSSHSTSSRKSPTDPSKIHLFFPLLGYLWPFHKPLGMLILLYYNCLYSHVSLLNSSNITTINNG